MLAWIVPACFANDRLVDGSLLRLMAWVEQEDRRDQMRVVRTDQSWPPYARRPAEVAVVGRWYTTELGRQMGVRQRLRPLLQASREQVQT